MRVLIADKFEKSGLDGLKAAGCDVVYQPDLKDDGLAAAFVQTLEQPLAWRHAVELGTAYFRQGWRDLGHSGRAGVGGNYPFFSIGESSVSPFPQAWASLA